MVTFAHSETLSENILNLYLLVHPPNPYQVSLIIFFIICL